MWGKSKRKRIEPTKHGKCCECGVVGHLENMVVVPGIVHEYLDKMKGGFVFLGGYRDRAYCKKCSPAFRRQWLGGWEPSEEVQKEIDEHNKAMEPIVDTGNAEIKKKEEGS